MNILFVCAEYPFEGQATGGFGRYVETIAEVLAEKKQNVTVLCKSSKETNIFFEQGVRIFPIQPVGHELVARMKKLNFIPFVGRLSHFLDFPILWSFSVFLKLERLEEKEIIDVIEGGDFGAELFFYLLLRRSHTKTVIKLHTPSFIIQKYNDAKKDKLFYTLMNFLELFCLKRVHRAYSPTRELAREVSKRIGIQVQDIIPYPIKEKNKGMEIKHVSNTVLYVGKLQVKKGVFVLLDAIRMVLQKNPKTTLLLIGPDTRVNGKSTKEDIIKFITMHKIQKYVHIIKEISHKKLLTYYQNSSLIVVPSIWENFPNVILEAMVHGPAIVASNVGGIKEMITDGREGILVAPGDSQKLAEKITKILHSPDLRISLIKQAYASAQRRFGKDKIGEMTLRFYQNL